MLTLLDSYTLVMFVFDYFNCHKDKPCALPSNEQENLSVNA